MTKEVSNVIPEELSSSIPERRTQEGSTGLENGIFFGGADFDAEGVQNFVNRYWGANPDDIKSVHNAETRDPSNTPQE